MAIWTIAPILLPLSTALLLLLGGKPSLSRRWLAGISGIGQLAVSLLFLGKTWSDQILVLPVGYWAANAGIVMVVDLLSAIMLSLTSVTSLAALFHGFAESSVRVEHPLRLPLMQFLVLGINLSFCTGDLFNLFVAFEVLLISSYALLTLEADDWEIKHAYPYIAINLVGSTLFISATGVAYGLFGTLNFAEIAIRARDMGDDPRVLFLSLMLLCVFGIKAGLFPLYYWLPNSYPTLPIPVAAIYSGMLTKVGVYVLLRVFGTVLPHDLHLAHHLLAWLAGITMLVAVLGAVSRNFMRGILSFHILSQIGFMVLAIGFFTPLSFAAAIFYIIHHIIVKSSLFLITGTAVELNGTDNLDRMGNLWKYAPWLGVMFLVQSLSLAGVPPLSGFWGKYVILVVGIREEQFWLVAAAIIASVLTLFSMLKIWNAAFWNTSDKVPVRLENVRWRKMAMVVAMLTFISLSIGLGADYVMRVAEKAANQTLDQSGYAAAVLSVKGKGSGL